MSTILFMIQHCKFNQAAVSMCFVVLSSSLQNFCMHCLEYQPNMFLQACLQNSLVIQPYGAFMFICRVSDGVINPS